MIKPYDIIVILLIVGLELLVHLPQKATQRVNQRAECKRNLKTIGTALEIYASDNDGKCPSNLAELAPSFLRDVPQCPAGGAYVYYKGKSAPQNKEGLEHYYYVECHGNAHSNVYPEDNLPAYSSTSGLIESNT